MLTFTQRSTLIFICAISLLSLIPVQLRAGSVQKLISLPEDKIDVGIAALTLAKEIYPDVNIAAYSKKIDTLVNEVGWLAKGTQDPDMRVRCLNTIIFQYEKFEANRNSSFDRKADNYFLNRVLDTKQANCFSMPVLYVAIAQRLGWPVYLVHVPDHSFVRYVDPTFKEQNIEATSGGGYISDDKYAKDFKVNELSRKRGSYLRTLTRRELLADLLEINAVAYGRQGRMLKSIAYLKIAIRINPRLVTAWANLANAYQLMAKHSNGAEAEEYVRLAHQCSKKLEELGFVHPKDVPQFTSTRGT